MVVFILHVEMYLKLLLKKVLISSFPQDKKLLVLSDQTLWNHALKSLCTLPLGKNFYHQSVSLQLFFLWCLTYFKSKLFSSLNVILNWYEQDTMVLSEFHFPNSLLLGFCHSNIFSYNFLYSWQRLQIIHTPVAGFFN